MDDPRLTPARPEIAAAYLEGKVAAARFVDGKVFEIGEAIAPLRSAPRADAPLLTQALKGERITIYDPGSEGWAWGQLHGDGYVGWLPDRSLTAPGPEPTHKVAVARTFAFPGPSIKLPPVDTLTLGATVAVARIAPPFAVTVEGWYLPASHLVTRDRMMEDFVAIAETFVGTPYLWGGKTGLGIDCSGLVQVALTACGIGAPRDSDMQEDGLGAALPGSATHDLQRGDLIFWKGHVAIVRDAATILHANAHHMATVVEPLHAAVARIAAAGSPITSIKRLR